MTTTTTFAQVTTLEITQLAQSKVSRSALLVYLAISSHLRGLDGDTSAFPSIKRIMALLGGSVARSTIFEALRQLKKAGLIKVEKTNERKSNTYQLKIRQVIKKALTAIGTQKGSNNRHKSKAGPASHSLDMKNRTHKRNRKRENSIDWDKIMFEWVKQGKTPSPEVIEKIPYSQKKWLKTYHPELHHQLRSII